MLCYRFACSWSSTALESHYRIREDLNSCAKLRYPIPMHTPKFLGVVYSCLGLRGKQFPFNQYAAMADANDTLVRTLTPCLADRGMLLPPGIYDAAKKRIPEVRPATTWSGSCHAASYICRLPCWDTLVCSHMQVMLTNAAQLCSQRTCFTLDTGECL